MLKNEFYQEGIYNYMWHEAFLPKWGVIAYFVKRYVIRPVRALDLGCGKVTILDYLDVSNYVGIDSVQEVVDWHKVHKGGRCVLGEIESFDLARLHEQRFNCLLWLGIATKLDECHAVLTKYLSVLDKDGIVILDCMATVPENAILQLGSTLLNHLNGVKLILPYVPRQKRKRWPKANERIIEVFKNS